MNPKENNTSRIDYGLVLSLMLMFLVSCISIYSAQTTEQYIGNFFVKQIVWYAVGILLIVIVVQFDTDQMKKLAWFLYGLGILLLAILYFAPNTELTPVKNGAQSWFEVKGFTLQPSEIVKVFFILALARTAADHHQKIRRKTVKTDLWLMVKMGAVALLPVFLIYKQPDLGTALVFIAILMGILFVAGISWKLLLPIVSGAAMLVGTVFYLVLYRPDILEKYLGVHPYQLKRVYSWLDPYSDPKGDGYQLITSLQAIGSGETVGKGFGGRVVYVAESHTDFIFSTIGEEFGFIGASFVVSLFFLLIYQITRISLEMKNDFCSYIGAGVIAMITFHVFQNIGMTIGLLPITGIPLPFISYGGSAIMGNMLAVGLIFSIRFHYKKYMFSSDT